MSTTKLQVLSCYKQLLRTRQKVFAGDQYALDEIRKKISEGFLVNKNAKSEEIPHLLQVGTECSEILDKTVLQMVEKENGNYHANVRKEHLGDTSKPFRDMPPHMIGPFKNKKKCDE